ncbi:hypothetical protein ACIF9R_18555 [Streptomyces sp. NPDC086080]|uniref:hypothetical protein n=1 Tax=Streptomyces sp. NPDC086080 TaxID=3365748 RepID=UPI0037D88065
MTAHDEARDPSREGAGSEYAGPEYDGEGAGPKYAGPEHAHDDTGSGYDGMDALMAALLGEPLPEPARRDPAFMSARDAAVADLAVLREQLTVIGDALAGPWDGVPAGRDTAARPGKRPDLDAGPGRDTASCPSGGTPSGAENAPAPVAPAPLTGPPSRSGGGRGHEGGSRGPHRARRRRAKVVLGGLVAAVAAGLVLGTGWLVGQGGEAADSAVSGAAGDAKEATGVAFGSPRYLACARLVAEGTVTAVQRVPGAAGVERVTLEASRYYKGEGEVAFLQDVSGGPSPREGERVLVGMPQGGTYPDTVLVGEPDIAPERARIVASLPESRILTCG